MRNAARALALTICAAAFGLTIQAAAALERVSPETAERVILLKSERSLMLLRDGEVLRRYRVALGRDPIGPKTRQGDGRTPEGHYVLDWRNPESRFHRSIHISYPNERDRARARRLGVPPGGDIMIHGLPPAAAALGKEHSRWDWTEGCVAVSNLEMDEIWERVPNGTPIEIRP